MKLETRMEGDRGGLGLWLFTEGAAQGKEPAGTFQGLQSVP